LSLILFLGPGTYDHYDIATELKKKAM